MISYLCENMEMCIGLIEAEIACMWCCLAINGEFKINQVLSLFFISISLFSLSFLFY